MKFNSDEEVETLFRAFETQTLPKKEWTHQAHLVVGLCFLRKFPQEEATAKIRAGIWRLNETNGTENTDFSGYHETITLFYIWTIGKFLSETNGENAAHVLANNLLLSHYADKLFPLKFYSRELLMSKEARKNWVEPDLKPLN